MSRVSLILCLLLAVPLYAQTPATNPPSTNAGETLASLQEHLRSHIGQARFAQARWGIKVTSLDSGKTIFEHDADKLVELASNTKLFTAALALQRLGPDFRVVTPLYASAPPSTNGVLAGDLIIRGAGDPSFSARFHNADRSASLQPIVSALVAAGIKRVEGDLVGDNSCFRNAPWGAGWEWDDLQWAYAPSVSALCLDDNAIGISVKPGREAGMPCQIIARTNCMVFQNLTVTLPQGKSPTIEFQRLPGQNTVIVTGGVPAGGTPHGESIAVADPAQWFINELASAMAQRGIVIAGRKRVVQWWDTTPVPYSNLVEIARVQSPPLRELLKDTMKHSQNLGAQLLLLQVGLAAGGSSRNEVTERAGIAEMRKLIRDAGIKPGAVWLKEGTGLSPNTQATPAALVSLLAWMTTRTNASAFVDALPMAGVDGTLADRFKGTRAEKRIWAKTGTREGVSSLSGYIVTQANERLVFSIILNSFKDTSGSHTAREETDTLARMLAEFTGHSANP